MSSSSPSPMREQCLSTANATIAAYNAWSLPEIMALRTPDCVHQVLPASLGREPRDNATYAAYLEPILGLFKDWHFYESDTIVDEVAKTVVMLGTSKAMTQVGEYANEYVLVFWLTEDGKSVRKILEFVDSGYSGPFFERLRAAQEGKEEEK